MNRFLQIAVLLVIASFTAIAGRAQNDIDRVLHTGAAPDLYVSSNAGRIQIVPGPDDQVHIHAHLYAAWNAGGDTEARIHRIVANPPVQQGGNAVHVGEASAEDRPLYNNIQIDYQIAAPRNVALNLRTGSGDIEVDGLGRFLKAETGSGSLRAHNIDGPADLHSASGDIELQEVGRGDVRASTGSGSIGVSGLAGGLQARTGSGDIEAAGQLLGSANLQSGSGSIRLHIGHDARYNLQASTGSGTIRVSQPGAPQTDDDRHRMDAAINGGGPTVQIRTGSGDIEIN